MSLLFHGRVVFIRFIQALWRLALIPASVIAIALIFSQTQSTVVAAVVIVVLVGIVIMLREVYLFYCDVDTALGQRKGSWPLVAFWKWVFGESTCNVQFVVQY